MRTGRSILRSTGLFPAILFAIVPSLAQTSPDSSNDPDALQPATGAESEPPVAPATGATYARLRQFEGGISLKREDESASQDLTLEINTPLIPGDQVWTGEDGRMEVQLADGTLVRLDHNSRLSLLNLADREATFDNTTLLRLMNGSLYLRADGFDAHDRRFQIDTPAGSVFLLSGGVFRIDVGADGVSTVASYRGVAEILSEDISAMAHSGERVTAEPGHRPGEARAFNTLRRDDFDLWAESRDDTYATNDSGRGARPDVPAPVSPYVSELNRYGTWRDDPSYGWVWTPDSVAPDWRPYYDGQWYDAPTGMTWVGSEPWGWAPYHYGRWQWSLGAGWFWIPGVVYSGAYVSWAVGPSYFGWCPLGFYNTPVYYNTYTPWVYVPHTYIYTSNVCRHSYSYSDVARYRLEQNSVVLRSQLWTRPGARPETVGQATYRRAMADPRMVQAKPGAGPGSEVGKASFKMDEQRTYRRTLAARQATLERGADRGGVKTPAQAKSFVERPGSASYGQAPGATAGPTRRWVGDRGRNVAQPPAAGSSGKIDAKAPVSPATGRPVAPPVKALPEISQSPRSLEKGSPTRGLRGPEGQDAGQRGPLDRPRQGAVAPTPHARADASRGGSGGGPFVMPARPPQSAPQARPQGGGAARPQVMRAPAQTPPKPQVAEKGKSGGKRR
jgi:uncharacterized protein DUF6600/FecR-like protein